MNGSQGLVRGVRWVLALALLVPALIAGYGQTGAAQVSGSSYTSPNFGYAVTWQSPWYPMDEYTDDSGFDVLGLADDQSVVYFSGGRSGLGSSQEVIDSYVEQIDSSAGITNLQPVDPAMCAAAATGDGAAISCYTGDQTYDDGSQVRTGVLLKAWDLGNGVDLLLEAYTDEALLASYLPKWTQFGVYAAGQPVPAATGGCQAFVEHEAAFCFDQTLSEQDRGDISESVRLGQDLLETYFGQVDWTDLRVNGFSAVSSNGDESLAVTLDHSIAVYTGSDVWQGIAPLERVETMVHELFHVYQNIMTEPSEAAVPLWFSEGTAESVGFQAVSQLGVTDQSEIYDMNLYSLAEYPVGPLSDLGTGDSMGADSYPLAYIAVQYLLASKGLSVAALGDVYTRLRDGASFDDAFTGVFGVSLDQFYAEFEAWRPQLQHVTELPDDFWPNAGDAPPAAITLNQVPQQVARDQQIVVVGTTTALTDCDADLQLSGQTVERATYANGEGAIFWLITIPANAPLGPATLSVDCGSTPVSTQIAVT